MPSISAVSTASWSLASMRASTSEQGAATSYVVVLKDDTDPSEVKQLCSYINANLGIQCRKMLQHTVSGFIVQVTDTLLTYMYICLRPLSRAKHHMPQRDPEWICRCSGKKSS